MSLAHLKKLLEDERVPAVAARVERHEGEDVHYRVNEEGDIVIQVVTLTHETPIEANLGALAGGAGKGVWVIPEEGVEVLISFDNGEFEGEAYVVGYYSSGAAPAGLVPGKVFVLGLSVEVRTVGGSAAPVATLEDVQELRDWTAKQFHPSLGHVHQVAGAATTTQAEATAPAPSVSTTAPSPDGTDVLLAE